MSENLYILPQGWEWKKLGDICDFQNGFAFKSQDFSETQKTFQVIRIGNVLDLNKNPVYINEQQGLERFRLYENDIVISMTGTRGKQDYLFVSLIKEAKYYLNQRVGKITANSSSLPKFLFYFLQTNYFRNKIFEFETGTVNQGNISGKDIMNMDIPLPPLEEQRRIVGKLDGLFAKIDKSIALLDESIASASALMPSALNEVFNANSIGEWKKYQFDKISKFIDYRGKTPVKTEEGIVLITAKNVRFGYLSDEPREYIASGDYEEWMTRGIPKIGDILFTTEAPLGNVALLDTDEKRAFAQRIVTFQAIGNEYDSNFLFWYLLSPYFQEELNKSATGTTVMGIKTAVLKKFEIPLPPLDIQTQTVAYLDALHVKAQALKKAQVSKKEELLALKASLLESAFKGEL